MRELVLTSKFKRSYRKFTSRNPKLKLKLQKILQHIREDVFAPKLATHSLQGKLIG